MIFIRYVSEDKMKLIRGLDQPSKSFFRAAISGQCAQSGEHGTQPTDEKEKLSYEEVYVPRAGARSGLRLRHHRFRF